jgi:hypothetical protein
MSDAAATITAALASPATPSAATTPRRDVDLYAEGNSFAEPENDTGTEIKALFGKDGFSFKDFLDIINPLQHLPVVGTLYRALTGDKLEPGSRIIGGTLFGGIGGFVSSLVNAVIEDETGSDIGDKALALLTGDSAPETNVAQGETPTAVASAAPPPQAAAGAVEAKRAPAPLDKAKPPPAHTLPIHAGPPSKLKSLASARAAGAKTAPPGTEDPTEALIRARAAVPALRTPLFAGLPPAASHSAARQASRAAAPATSLALANAAPQQGPGPEAPASAARASEAVPSTPSPNIASMMRDALDKYEALMKARNGHSISAEF